MQTFCEYQLTKRTFLLISYATGMCKGDGTRCGHSVMINHKMYLVIKFHVTACTEQWAHIVNVL
jgi:hypothetical protein